MKRMQAQYDSDLKDQEILSLHQKTLIAAYQKGMISLQSAKRKTWIIIVVVSAVLLLVISVGIFLRIQARQKNKSLQQQLEASEQTRLVEDQLRLSQIKAIKAQLNPHFMFNVLTSLQHFVMNNDSKNALLHLGNFSDLMRNILRQSEAHWISLKDEMQLLKNYTDLEALRFSDGILYDVMLELPMNEDRKALESDEVMIPSLLIQPLVENAIKHGLSTKSGKRIISVTIKPEKQSQLRIVVTDNGIGRKASSSLTSKNDSGISLGMRSVEERLNNVYKATNTAGALKVEDLLDDQQQASGTRVSFIIPFVQEDQIHRQQELII